MRDVTKRLLAVAASVALLLGAAGCTSAGAKVVKHEVKKAIPGVDTKGEKVAGKVDGLGGGDDRKPGLLDRESSK